MTSTVEETFRIRENEGKNKLTSLYEAIQRNLEPGMKLYITPEAGAAVCEIIRQYYGKSPAFTLIQPIVSDHSLNLVHCRLIKKLIMSSGATFYPVPGPSKIIQTAFKDKTAEFENWSLYSRSDCLRSGSLHHQYMQGSSG